MQITKSKEYWNQAVRIVQQLEHAQWQGEPVTDRELKLARNEAALWRAQIDFLENPPAVIYTKSGSL